MTRVILLAAGAARRFGSDKLLALCRGKPLYRYGLETLASVCAERADADLTVVTNNPRIAADAVSLGARAVDSPQAALGQSYSIRAGLDAVEPLGAGDFLLFVVADQPGLRPATIKRFLDAAKPGRWGATAVCGDRVGNPVLFCAALAPALRALEGDRGGRRVLNQCPGPVLPISCAEAELRDVDCPGDLSAIE